jgi:selenocysteine lyase/cysteine desulfurase
MNVWTNRGLSFTLFFMNIEQFKSHYYFSSDACNLNNAGQAQIPDVYLKKAHEWFERFYKEGAGCAPQGWQETESVRGKLAKFLGADVDEVSYFQTTASALSQAAFGIPLQKDDEIITWDQEYPSNFYPWRLAAEKSGAKVIQLKSVNWETPLESLLKQITAKTKVIAVSWVQYQTGSVTDLKGLSEALKGKGIWLVADGIQGVGIRPFNFHATGFDIVCGGSHKWLCSGYGASYMLIKKERIKELRLLEAGAMTFGDSESGNSFTLSPRENARRFEPGSKAMVEIIAMGTCLDLFASVGMPAIFTEATRLADRLREGLVSLGYVIHSLSGPIVNFSAVPDRMATVESKLRAAKITFAPKRGPGIRVSPHAYNRDSEIDYFLNTVG